MVDEIVLGEPAEAARVGEQMRERRCDRPLREKRAERFALVEAEGRDVDEADDVRSVRAERGDDLAAVGVSDDDRGAVLELEHLTQPGDVVRERAQRELRRPHLEAVCLEALDDAAPAGPVGPGAMDENDVRPAVHFDHSLPRVVGRQCAARGVAAHRTILRFESCSRGLGYARRGGRMPTVPAREFHGRDAELALVRGELERLSGGAEAVVVVEGAAGMGKSRLLAEVAVIARSLGIRVGRSAADPSETMVELATLLAALFDGAEPLLDPGALSTLHAQPEQRFWLLRDLQQLLEQAALESPLLITVDDAHWADAGTVAAIRTLPMRLMGLPIAWVIALRPPREATPLVHALEHLKQEGARPIDLGPLDDDAVVRLAAEILGAQPDQSILKQLADADGSPFLVVETLLGLQEEERIRVVDGRAQLIDSRLPRRVHEKMRERLGRLSDEASDAVTVAASLGRTFTFDRARTHTRAAGLGSARTRRGAARGEPARRARREAGVLARPHPRGGPCKRPGHRTTRTRPSGRRCPARSRRLTGRGSFATRR